MLSGRQQMLVVLLTLGIMFSGVASGGAAIVTLTDRNSTVEIDPNSQAGMFNWVVDGTNHLFQQWFWFRVGSTGGESSVDTLLPVDPLVSNTNRSPGPDFLSVLYGNSDPGNGTVTPFTIQIDYNLRGGVAGSRASDIAENITIVNNGTSALDFHFFQYSDFDLEGSSGGDTLQFVNANTVRQAGESVTLSETVVTPAATHHEGNLYPNTRDALNDGSPTTLNDLPAISGGTLTGDVTWAFEWDVTIAAGGSFSISKDKRLDPSVPEPCSLALWAGLSAFGLLIVRRQQRRQAA